MSLTRFLLQLVYLSLTLSSAMGTDYYVHPLQGSDDHTGRSPSQAVRTLERAAQLPLGPGDRLLLAAGAQYPGTLKLINVRGLPDRPVTITSVAWPGSGSDSDQPARIDAKGFKHGLLLQDCQYIHIDFLAIRANGYRVKDDESTMRCGILVTATAGKRTEGIVLDKVDIRDIFYENPGYSRPAGEVRTPNGTQSYGWGIRIISQAESARIENIRIRNCRIENIEHTGIKLTGTQQNINRVWLQDNLVTRTGGPGIQMSNVRFVHVCNNEVTYSGSSEDPRKWGRGSGLWTWSSSHILIEKNRFMYASGPGDSAGAHIDFNCDNVVLQYNFSAYNAGGFCEILGNTYNCSYRYNISVNDGHRVKGENGAFQEGKTFWLSGYQGNNKDRKGPINTYFYNNTIFVDETITAKFAIDERSDGVLIANNIFYIAGNSLTVLGDQNKPDQGGEKRLNRIIFTNNLYLKPQNWPGDLPIQDSAPFFGDPEFVRKGSLVPSDYLPRNTKLVKGKGVRVPYLQGDAFGLMQGLYLPEDFAGRETGNPPGLGALETN